MEPEPCRFEPKAADLDQSLCSEVQAMVVYRHLCDWAGLQSGAGSGLLIGWPSEKQELGF